MNELLNEVKNLTGLNNQSETSKFTSSLPEPGRAPMRFVGYVELGTQPQPDYKGTPKPPAKDIILTFEVFGTKNTREIEVDGKKKKVGALIQVNITEKLQDKAKFTALFNNMKYGREGITHMVQMLDEVFLGTVRIGESKTTKRKYATIQKEDGSYTLGRPVMETVNEDGEITGEVDVSKKCPPASVAPRVFLVDNPSIAQWNSIYIDGTYTRKVKDDAGVETEEENSKNFLQEKIMNSLDWEGSKMQLLLDEVGENTDEEEEIKEEDFQEEEKPVAKKTVKTAVNDSAPSSSGKPAAKPPAKTVTSDTKQKPKPPAKKSVDKQVDDDLASMGL